LNATFPAGVSMCRSIHRQKSGIVDVTDVKDSGPRDIIGTLPADTWTESGMASTKSGCRSFSCKGLVNVANAKDSDPKGESEVMT